MKKLEKKNLIIIAIVALISILGISYAFFNYYMMGKNNHQLIAGEIYLTLTDKTNSLNLIHALPQTVEEARARTDNVITFTVNGKNTTKNKDIIYEIMLNEGVQPDGRTNRIAAENLRFDLIEIIDGVGTLVVDAACYDNIDAKRIWVSTVNRDTNEDVEIIYKLRMWIDEDVLISDTDPNATYTTGEFKNSYASVRVSVFGDFSDKSIPIFGFINYDMNSEEIEDPEPTPFYENVNSVSINNTINSNTVDGFLGWSLTPDGEVVYQPGDKVYKNDLVNNVLTLYAKYRPTDLYSVASMSLARHLTEADVDGARYVAGSTVPNNYVWYSGKLWRIVSFNNDGTVKLVTQNSMTVLHLNITANSDYSTSQARTWLTNEFLPTLHNSDDLVATSNWDYTTYATFPTEKITDTTLVKTVPDKVGLLSIYDYMMTGGTETKSNESTYLYNGFMWAMISPQSNESFWYFDVVEFQSNYNIYILDANQFSSGIRPVINLVSEVELSCTDCDGTLEKPYTIKGDIEIGQTNEALNTRISGEYINFNDVTYRIVGIENGLTKVTMYDLNVNNNILGNYYIWDTFTYVNNWYNATSETDTAGEYAGLYLNDSYKQMIATEGFVWYQGVDVDNMPELADKYTISANEVYTLAKSGTEVDAIIGAPYYGEMFSAHFEKNGNYSSRFGLGTIRGIYYGDYEVVYYWVIEPDGYHYIIGTSDVGIRPSFYLKSDVKISGGNGTSDSPYELTMAS